MTTNLSAPCSRVPVATRSVDVRVVDSVDQISVDDWRRVSTGRGLYSSPRWLRSLEDDPWHDVWYVTVRDGEGALDGVLPVYLTTQQSRAGSDSFYDPGEVFFSAGGERPLVAPEAASRWRPSVLAGGRAGYETELLLSSTLGAGERRAVLQSMVDRCQKLADAWGIDGRAVMYLLPDAAAELAPVLEAQPLLTEVTAAITLDGLASLDDHILRLPSKRRVAVRREIRGFAEAGLTLRWTALHETVDVIAKLLAPHHQRYGHADTAQMLAHHLRQQAAELDDLSHVLLCEHSGDVLGALLVFEWDGTWYARVVAAGDGLRGEAHAFFTLVFYAPLARAIELGISRYVLGPSSVEAKVRRGATLETRFSLLSGRGALRADVRAIEDTWNGAQSEQWALQFGHRAG